jgi:predicted acyl esterase
VNTSARGRGLLTVLLLFAVLLTVLPSTAAASADGPIVFRPKGITKNRFATVDQPTAVTIMAHDGVDLFMWIYRPDTAQDPKWRTPIILAASPYFDLDPPTSGYLYRLVPYFTPKGYTVVFSHVRGTARSGGCLEQDGSNQQRDFGTVVEYLARRPWSNGRVGSYGISYDGETQNAGAIHHPRGLATIIPMEAISGLYETVYFDGVPLYVANPTVAASYAVGTLTPGNTHYTERPWCQPEQILRNADPSGTMTPYFQEREFRLRVSDIRASVLYVEGFGDDTVLPINLDGFYDRIPSFKRAIIGQWNHEVPDDNATGHGRKDWFDIVHAWLDHELLRLDTGVQRWPPVQVQDENNVWRAVPSFAALSRRERLPLGLGTFGKAAAPGTGQWFTELSQALWVGPALDRGLHLSGQVFLDAFITLDRSDAHFILHVEEVKADGTVRLLTQGFLSAPHNEDLTRPAPVPPGVPLRYHIRTYPFDTTLAPGSHVRVVLSGVELFSSRNFLANRGIPAGTLYRARVAIDGRSTVTLPVVREVCGMDVRQSHALKVPVPGC